MAGRTGLDAYYDDSYGYYYDGYWGGDCLFYYRDTGGPSLCPRRRQTLPSRKRRVKLSTTSRLTARPIPTGKTVATTSPTTSDEPPLLTRRREAAPADCIRRGALAPSLQRRSNHETSASGRRRGDDKLRRDHACRQRASRRTPGVRRVRRRPRRRRVSVTPAQYVYLGHNYCWYDSGWQGPGLLVRLHGHAGFGWGGGEGCSAAGSGHGGGGRAVVTGGRGGESRDRRA